MRISLRLLAVNILLTAFAAAAVAADDLSSLYASILRGDYESSRRELKQLQAAGVPPTELAQVESWLEAYEKTVKSRSEMKAETFSWNVKNAKEALEKGDVYLALSFAAQAAPYAPDAKAYAAEDWVKTLIQRAREAAQNLREEGKWSKVLAHFTLLKRIDEENETIEQERKHALRHARLEVLYEDREAVDRRIEAVDKDLLRTAIRLVYRNYYREPDFKEMAEGALESLVTLAETGQLYEFMHGLGNPVTRQFFLDKLHELQEQVRTEERYNYKDLIRLYNSIDTANRESVELPEGLLVMEFMEGALDRLDDFTSIVWPADAVDFDKMMMGGFEGVGIQLGLDDATGRLKVVTPLEDSPALEQGIQPGDLIVEVDGESTKGWSTDDAVRNIMGKAGTPVTLTMFRPATGEKVPFTLIRRKIVLRTVRGVERLPEDPENWNYILDPEADVAYIRLSGFHPDSHEELVKALQQARDQGMRGLVLDLRHNPGGLLEVAVRIVSTFLREGEVVSTGGRHERRTSLRVTEESFVTDVPLVILVNEGSASASEIFAGALRDHDRAIVLGERTFGKGSVQRVLSLGNQARVKLTTSLYYLPSGRSPHRAPEDELWGVDPNWQLVLTPKEFREVIKRENEAFIIHNEEKKESEQSEEQREKQLQALRDQEEEDEDGPPLLTEEQIKQLEADPVEALDFDPQLETALLLLRVKLAGNLPWPQQLAVKMDEAKP